VLVTGASGFIGSHLVDRLTQAGLEVHGVSRRAIPHAGGAVRWWQADLADAEAVREVVQGVAPAVIYHLASHVAGARDVGLVMPTFASNLQSTVNLLAAAVEAGGARVILTGSMEEPVPGGLDAVPCSPYAAAKYAATGYARMFHALYGLPVVTLRVFMVYGPGQQDVRKLVPYVVLSLLRGEAPRLMSGERQVDWVFVNDVVDALVAAGAPSEAAGRTLDVGSGQVARVREIVERLVELIDPKIVPQFGAVPDRALEQVRVADVGPTEAVLGWKPATALDEGLRRTIDWYASHVR
jgi:UDP-glucose 4-epimerase